MEGTSLGLYSWCYVWIYWGLLHGNLCDLVVKNLVKAISKTQGIVNSLLKLWVPCDFLTDEKCGQFDENNSYIIWVLLCAALFIGLYEWYFDYELNGPILFFEIYQREGDLKVGFHTFFITGVSMAFGAALGPEMGLCALGAGIGQVFKDHLKFDNTDFNDIIFLSGVGAAPFGALLPSPMLGSILLSELDQPPRDYMEHTTVFGLTAAVSWVVNRLVSGVIFGPTATLTTDGHALGVIWEQVTYHHVLVSFILGLLCAVVGMFAMVIRTVCKKMFMALRGKLHNKLLKYLLPILIGGAVLGVTGYLVPSAIGFSNLQNRWLIDFGSKGYIPMRMLILTFFVRILNLGVSATSGFRGGIFMSLLSVGVTMGVIVHRLFPTLPLALCVGSCLAGVPSTFTAVPYMWTGLVCAVFGLRFDQSATIFITCLISYVVAGGTGVMMYLSDDGPGGLIGRFSSGNLGGMAGHLSDDNLTEMMATPGTTTNNAGRGGSSVAVEMSPLMAP